MTSFDPRRFGARIDDEYRIAKGKEDYLYRHEIPFPHLDRPGCRPSHSKTTPLYQPLKARGAVYQDVYGWERPYWYAPEGLAREHIHSFRRSALHGIVGAEVEGMRTGAAIADLSAFAKIEIHGPDAAAFLERVSSNRLPMREGAITLSYMVNANGRLEGEATLMRRGPNRFYMVYSAAREASLLDWMDHQRQADEAVAFDNLSEAYGVILLAGPRAREILARTTRAPLDNDAFPWLSAREISVAGVDGVRAMRVTYTGELGWELHLPMAGMTAAYEALIDAGGSDLVHMGVAALNAVRMEKAYKSGHEITNEVTLAEAGLGRFARKGGFQGAGPSLAPAKRWQLALLRLGEPEGVLADPLGSEAVLAGEKVVGSISSGGYGYGIGAYLAWAYLQPEFARPGQALRLEVLGRMRDAQVTGGAVWDPENARARS